jgi:hypothetical protein
MPSAESQVTMEVAEGFGHGTWNVPATLVAKHELLENSRSAESLVTMEVAEGFGHGTWNVPATLGGDEESICEELQPRPVTLRSMSPLNTTGRSRPEILI